MAKTYVIYKMYNAWVPFQKYYQKCKKKIRQKTSTVTDKQEIEKGGKTRLHPHKKKKIICYIDATAIHTRDLRNDEDNDW